MGGPGSKDDAEREERAYGHEDRRGERVHASRKAEADGKRIVKKGERDDGADRGAAAGGDFEKLADACQAASEEIEVGFLLEQSAVDGGRAAAERLIEGEAVVGPVARGEKLMSSCD